MNHPDTPKDGDFATWVEEKSDAVLFELGEKFHVSPTAVGSPTAHVEPVSQNIDEVLLGHEEPSAALLDEIVALDNAPPLSEAELERQAMQAGGADGDSSTPE